MTYFSNLVVDDTPSYYPTVLKGTTLQVTSKETSTCNHKCTPLPDVQLIKNRYNKLAGRNNILQ